MIRKFIVYLTHPALWKLAAIFLLACAIWFIGPLFAFAEWRPLEAVSHRIILIALLLAYSVIKKIIAVWRVHRINDKFIDALAGKGLPDSNSGLAIDELSRNFARAMGHLKNSTADTRTGFFAGLRKRFVYQFPWYVFIGAPGSGKTTALINSGLQFPLTDVVGREPLKGVGGTRNCDWWFTDDAVFIDTAGRYITHESHSEYDKDEWLGFLGLLKKFRPKQPLNGAVLTISMSDLLAGSEQSRDRHAAIIKARLSELGKSLGISFPVYILITKADLLGGFSDYFSDLSKEEREQVLGFTFPPQPDHASGKASVNELIRTELGLIARRLFDGMSDIMLRETDLSRRAHAYAFPQNFSNCLPLIGDVVDKVFSGSDLSGVQVRGVYFASGTQEGTPFDRVLGALGRRFGVSSSININKKGTGGRSFFLKDLITKVILPEAHLAGKNRREEKKELWFGLGAHSLILCAFLLFSAFLAGSYYKNIEYLKSIEAKSRSASAAFSGLSDSGVTDFIQYLPVLNELCCLAEGNGFPVEEPPLPMTFGLYQGLKLDSATQYAYDRALRSTLLPVVAQRLERLVDTSSERDLDLTYQSLKAYLMLNQPANYDGAQLLAFVEADFKQNFSPDISREQQSAMLFHLRNLLSQQTLVSPYAMNERLVQDKRRTLSGFSFAERAYQTVKASLLKNNVTDFSFLSGGGAKVNFVFQRNSGKPLSDGIPGLYTRSGYRQVFLPALEGMLADIVTEESWVLGSYSSFSSGIIDALKQSDTELAVTRLYLQDYAALWDNYLGDLRLVETRSMSESIDVARILSAVDSPLIQLLDAAAQELRLTNGLSASSGTVTNEVVKRVTAKVPGMGRTIDGLSSTMAMDDALEDIVDIRFKELVDFSLGSNKEAEKSALLKMFNEVYINLSNTDFSIRSGARALGQQDVIAQIRSEAARYPIPVRTILEGLTDEGKRQAEGGVRGALSAELTSSVGEFCRVAISGRYPFDRTSKRDVTFADFSKMFAPAGMMDSFFNEHLRPITDMSTRTWSLRQSNAGQLPIESFQQAAKIRDVFFPAGARTPALNFEYKVLEMDAAINQLSLDFDGQLFQYAHGPQIPRAVSWPGPLGTNQIRVELSGAEINRKSMVVNGPWALMRLFDLGERRRLQPEKFITTLFIHGHKVVLEVTASSVNNPFYLAELSNFSCPVRR